MRERKREEERKFLRGEDAEWPGAPRRCSSLLRRRPQRQRSKMPVDQSPSLLQWENKTKLITWKWDHPPLKSYYYYLCYVCSISWTIRFLYIFYFSLLLISLSLTRCAESAISQKGATDDLPADVEKNALRCTCYNSLEHFFLFYFIPTATYVNWPSKKYNSTESYSLNAHEISTALVHK